LEEIPGLRSIFMSEIRKPTFIDDDRGIDARSTWSDVVGAPGFEPGTGQYGKGM
jgi:hypothetical protein